MDDCELDLLRKELEADHTDALKYVDRELEKKARTVVVDDYERLENIGQGTFGEVFKVRHKVTKEQFALKRLKIEQETEGLCEHDLGALLARKIDFNLGIKKSIMKQLFTGLFYLHKNNVLHRDLKTSNILIGKGGILKIADFGLARLTVVSARPDRPPRYTSRVVTLWYRPPEILLNDRSYGRPVDMWGAGCIMAELWTRCPIMQGDIELTQLNLIIQLCGSITPEVWPEVRNLEAYQKIKLPKDVRRHVREKLSPQISCPSAVDLIDKLLMLDPSKRLSADQALAHDFFQEDPPPGELSSLCKNRNSFMECPGQVDRIRPGMNNFRGVAPNAPPNFVRRVPVAPGAVGAAPGFPVQSGAGVPYRYRGLPPEQDTSNISDRIF